MSGRRSLIAWIVIALVGASLAGCSSSKKSGGSSGTAAATTTGYFIYFDQNEEQNYLHFPDGKGGHLIPAWDPNGQLCVLNDGSGRFVTGYNPTLPSQHNPGSNKPYKDPPVGEALWDKHGDFTGTALYVPGPYHLPGGKVGEDVPPDLGSKDNFNNNGTFTGCAVDSKNNVFGNDIGTAQGSFPVPDNGRLLEWFAPDYKTSCIVDGPTSGGDGAHHVDGTGGLKQPGTMAVDTNGDLLLPEAGDGQVLRIAHDSLPASAADCPNGVYPKDKLNVSTFVRGLAFPLGIARDPACNCWAIDSVIGNPAIAFFDDQGKLLASPQPVPGTQLGDPNGYSPFGIAVAPDGTLYFVDIHVQCKNNQISDCGPADNGGRLMKVEFTNGVPTAPIAIKTGYNFPVSVTVCVPGKQTCPEPRGGPGTDGAGGTGPGTHLGGKPPGGTGG